jgi:cytochrome c553
VQGAVVVAIALALLGVAPVAGAADAAAPELSEASRTCIMCHGPEGMATKPASGAAATRPVDGTAFARSLHGPLGCEGCHAEVALPAHPGNVKRPESARSYALAQSQTCRACHARVFQAQERSVHAVRLREGNTASPVCGDCHSPHEVTPASVQDGPKNACAACHYDAAQLHAKWLSNAASHVRAVACSACHAPASLRRLDLRLHDGAQPVRGRDAAALFEQRARAIDANSDGLDAIELRALLADLEQRGLKVTLKGRIELRSGIEAHELPGKATAIRDCVKCHDENAAPFQSVVISILDADGRPVRYDAHKEILSSAVTWDALRGFYAIGGTRFKLLDYVLAIGLVGGIAVPVVHLALRRYLGRQPKDDGASK